MKLRWIGILLLRKKIRTVFLFPRPDDNGRSTDTAHFKCLALIHSLMGGRERNNVKRASRRDIIRHLPACSFKVRAGLNDLFKIIDINGGPPPLVVEFILLLYSNPRSVGKREKTILGTLSLSLFITWILFFWKEGGVLSIYWLGLSMVRKKTGRGWRKVDNTGWKKEELAYVRLRAYCINSESLNDAS